jgi:exodeoxyribonuclease V beta subunit
MNFAPFDLATAPLEPGTVLLEASAGTGKTYTLVGILLRLLVEGRIERLDQALVVTFTVAATEELKNRLRAALHAGLAAARAPGKDRFLDALAARPGAVDKFTTALASFDQVAISTIHGFCKRLLDETAFECHAPFSLEFTPDPLPLLQSAAADALRTLYEPGITARSAVLAHENITPASLVESFRLWRRHPDVALPADPPALAAAMAPVEAALAACATAGDDAAVAEIERVVWGKNKSPFAEPLGIELPRLQRRLATNPASVLSILLALPVRQLRKRHLVGTPAALYQRPLFVACERLAGAVEAALPHLHATLLASMLERVELGKRSDGVLTFDDLLLRAHAALQDPVRRPTLLAALRARHTVGLIDEFQDTDSLQYRIFADCFAGRTLFLIGDPKQAIYGFRGADLRTYLDARGDAVRRHTLAQNHRSAAPLVAAVSHWFDANPRPFLDDRILLPRVQAAARSGELALTGDGDAVLRVRFVPSPSGAWHNKPTAEGLVAVDVADEAVRLLTGSCRLDGRPLQPRDLAVLTRTNRQAVLVQEELRRRGIPSAIGKAGDIFLTEEVAELRLFLLAVLQPGDLRRLRAAMATRLWGIDPAGLVRLEHAGDTLDAAIERLDRWRRLWLRHGFIVMQEQALVDLQVHDRFLGWTTGERRLTNFRQLFELLHEAEHAHRLSPEGLVEWLAHERHNQEDLDYTLRELRLESDDDAAQILTVHGSKGLQYEVVFCPFLWDVLGPRLDADVVATPTGHELVLDLTGPRRAQLERERLEEALRLAYVAMTRAKRRCYVHWGILTKSSPKSPLGWLLHGADTVPGFVDGKQKDDWLTTWGKRCDEDRSRWLDRVRDVAATSGGTIEVTVIPGQSGTHRLTTTTPAGLPQPRRPERLVRAQGLHSFSSLVARSHDAEPAAATEIERRPESHATIAPRGIFAFARGPGPGQCLHTILERVDLQQIGGAAARAVVQEVLAAAGLESPEAHTGEIDPVVDVQQALVDLAGAHAFVGGPTLAALCSGPRAIEWQFTLPATNADLHALARLFARSATAPTRHQGERLLDQPSLDLRGFLVGFADLVAEHDGRFWVLDWKSNHLGNDASCYTPDLLLSAMVDHDYVLQYHLYVLALHRQLRVRLPGYDPNRHLGGVVYAFLRGAVPGTTCGMFFDRVPVDVVVALDRWLDGHKESR